jgi:hypothetical protein
MLLLAALFAQEMFVFHVHSSTDHAGVVPAAEACLVLERLHRADAHRGRGLPVCVRVLCIGAWE